MINQKNIQIKRVCAIHDLCGYGKCSLGIVIPVISAAGFEVCSIPAGIYSTHTAIKGWQYIDTSTVMKDYIKTWKKANVHLDAIYSGFISNKKQSNLIIKLFNSYKNALKIVDPAMADNGKLYDSCTNELKNSIVKLIKYADIITPNITEACLLTNTKYKRNFSEQEILNIIYKLKQIGSYNIVLTSAIISNGIIYTFVYDNENCIKIPSKFYNYKVHGTGDLYTSIVVAKLLSGNSLIKSVKYSSSFLEKALDITVNQSGFQKRGISFEPLLHYLY